MNPAAAVLLRGMLRLEQWGTVLAFLVMVGVLGADIIGRELLGSGKIWATPVAVYANVFMAFIGMGVASAGGAHLRPKMLDKAVPRTWDAMFDRFTDIGFALFAAAACVLCLRMAQETRQLAETDAVLQWQVWPFQWFLVAAFAFAVLRHLCYATWPALRPQSQATT
jgi:TRAP-type C4-dicarboxylate transport system permease small subunit